MLYFAISVELNICLLHVLCQVPLCLKLSLLDKSQYFIFQHKVLQQL